MLANQHQKIIEHRQDFLARGIDICPRNGWEQWPPVESSDRWYPWMIIMLVLITVAAPDSKCREMCDEMFRRFPEPKMLCVDPQRAMDILASKCKGYKPVNAVEPMTTGSNYGKKKAEYVIICSKILLLRFLKRINYPPLLEIPIEDLEATYCGSTEGNQKTTWDKPIPEEWYAQVNRGKKNRSDNLVPKHFDKQFFATLLGIGQKMYCLIAEAVYGTPFGPACDRHLRRYVVENQIVPKCATDSDIEDFFKELYDHQPVFFTFLNEVPGMIAQIFNEPKLEYMHKHLTKELIHIAASNGFGDIFPYYLRMYLPYTKEDETNSLTRTNFNPPIPFVMYIPQQIPEDAVVKKENIYYPLEEVDPPDTTTVASAVKMKVPITKKKKKSSSSV